MTGLFKKRWLDIGVGYRRLLFLLAATAFLVVVATVGFMYFEDLSLFDALWMTVISVMTVGYGDIYPVTQAGKSFALFLVPAGAAIVTYGLGTAATFIIEKQLAEKVWEKQMNREIQELENHIIVCGFGRIAQQVYKQLKEEEGDKKILYIHDNEEELLAVVDRGTLRLIGDPMDKDILLKARVDNAHGLIAALKSDADNVFITLTAKSLNEDIEIAARAEKEGSEDVLKRAGASRVINPSVIGGRELAMSVMKPTGIDYINDLIRSGNKDFMVEEIELAVDSTHLGQSIEEADVRKNYGVTIVAIMRDKELISNPNPTELFKKGDTLIAIGAQDAIQKLYTAMNKK